MASEENENIEIDENVNANICLEEEMMENQSDSGSSDSDVSEEEEVDEERVNELQQLVVKNPFVYDTHLELIKLLRKSGELMKLREARENMSKLFPLTPELWLEWLSDESKFISLDEKESLTKLFERAVKDYTSVPLWLEYAQFSIGNMGLKNGVENVRNIFERALIAVGLHVTQGSLIWEAYREFELVMLKTLQPSSDSDISPEEQEQIKEQSNRILTLFRRQLSVPLFDMEKTYEEFIEWSNSDVSSSIDQLYHKAKAKLSKLQPFEDSLLSSESPHLQEYYSYIDFEAKENDPSRMQCIYERAIVDNCLVPDLWQKYTKYLDNQLKLDSVVLPVHERAVRNCPWSVTLWNNYILAMERYQQQHESIKEVIERALQAGFSQGGEFKLLWLTYLDYLRRRIKWEENHETELNELKETFQKAVDHLCLYFGSQDDYTTDIYQYWARIEAKKCKNMQRARELWNKIISSGHGSEAQMWIEFANLERAYGDVNHCRRILVRGLHSASDWPEVIGEALLNFEREEGTLESLDTATEKYEAQMARIQERRQKKAEKEAEQQRLEDEQKKFSKATRKSNKAGKKNFKSAKVQHSSERENLKRKNTDSPELEETSEDLVKVDSEGFKIPRVPGVKSPQAKSPVKPEESDIEPKAKKQKLEEEEEDEEEKPAHGTTIEHDSKKDNRTVFLSNLSYSTEEDTIRTIFKEIGEITDLRLVRDYRGRSKGYCYLEFSTGESASEALKKDRVIVEGRPLFVSPCEDRKNNPYKKPFKFNTGLEKTKLFIRGLPHTTTEDELQELFKPYGTLKDVRIVTYRNGRSKGLAYIEYTDESSASAALVKTDGSKLGENILSVAISNPPDRKQKKTEGQRTTTTLLNSLGSGGGSSVGPRGRGRTQLAMVPRSLRQSQSVPRSSKQNGESNGSDDQKMSNEDFRRLLFQHQ